MITIITKIIRGTHDENEDEELPPESEERKDERELLPVESIAPK
jgi:hypothetical protein